MPLYFPPNTTDYAQNTIPFAQSTSVFAQNTGLYNKDKHCIWQKKNIEIVFYPH